MRPTAHSEQILTTVRPAQLARIDAVAERLECSRSQLIREAVMDRVLTEESIVRAVDSRVLGEGHYED